MIEMNSKAVINIESAPGSGKFNKKIPVQFNPVELSDVYTAEYSSTIQNKNRQMYYNQTQRGDLTLNLLIDGTEPIEQSGISLGSPAARLKELFQLVKPSESRNERQVPPRAQFIWGEYHFLGYVKSLTEKRTLFSADGEILRAEVTLVLLALLETEFARELEPKSNSRKSHTVLASDRLDLLADRYFGDARLWRSIAEENNIERPALFPGDYAGRILFIPDLSPRELAKRQARLRSV